MYIADGSNCRQEPNGVSPQSEERVCASTTLPDLFMSRSGAILEVVRRSVLSTTPTAEKPALSDDERAERRRRLAERVFSPNGLDRDTLKHIEQLTDNES